MPVTRAAVQHARTLRKNATPAQQALWQQLRNRRLLGCKFRRQHPIGTFIAEFVCIEKKLIVEICSGGDDYFAALDAELAADAPPALHDYATLRVTDDDVLNNMRAVLGAIATFLSCPP